MTGNELAREETEHGNVAQDKMRQEEVVNNKVKITPIPEEEGEEGEVRLDAAVQCGTRKAVCEAEHGELVRGERRTEDGA